MTFSRFRSSFFSDRYCSHSEIKLAANIKVVAALQEEGPDSASGQCMWLGIGRPMVRIPAGSNVFLVSTVCYKKRFSVLPVFVVLFVSVFVSLINAWSRWLINEAK